MRNIILSDVTIKTCAEAGSQQLTFKEKLETARLLDGLSVPVIELPKIAHERADSLLIKSIAGILNNSVLSVDAGLTKDSIEMTWEALKEASTARLQVVAPVSSVQMEYLYHLKPAAISVHTTISRIAIMIRDKSPNTISLLK